MTSLSHHNSAAELLRRYDLDDSRRKASGWKSLQKHRSSKRKVMPHSSSERALDTRKMVQDRPSSAHNAAVTVRPTGRGGLSYTKGQRPRTAMRTAVDSFQRCVVVVFCLRRGVADCETGGTQGRRIFSLAVNIWV